jgi:hypothetical protein
MIDIIGPVMTFLAQFCKKSPFPPSYHAIVLLFVCLTAFSAYPLTSLAKPYFEDGFLGLTQEELHTQLGTPMAVRSRKAALRIFSYYTYTDWQKYFKNLVSPENGEDVYTYTRHGIQVRYSFTYVPDLSEGKDFPTLYVRRCEIEFSPAVSLETIPSLVPEFVPPSAQFSPAFRSNLWVLLFKGPPSPEASFIVRERGKERLSWSLAYQMFAVNGIPNVFSIKTPIDRLEITTQSLQLVQQQQRLTHEPILNPFSPEFQERLPIEAPTVKSIPRPQYED